MPVVHKGWFKDTLPHDLPERICFAHLDGDLYDSILVSLEHVYPRLSKGAICLIDDYSDPAVNPQGWNQLPGVKQACDEFLCHKPKRRLSFTRVHTRTAFSGSLTSPSASLLQLDRALLAFFPEISPVAKIFVDTPQHLRLVLG
jgi:hypothetical protein